MYLGTASRQCAVLYVWEGQTASETRELLIDVSSSLRLSVHEHSCSVTGLVSRQLVTGAGTALPDGSRMPEFHEVSVE